MSAAASLSHQQWEQQLSGIIERTNANLNALSTRYSPARPAESVRRSAERQSWDAFEAVSYTHLTLPTICSV